MVKYKIIWLPEAKQDVEQIYLYIKYHLKEPIIAQKLYSKIKNTVLSLKYFPERNLDAVFYGIDGSNSKRVRINNYILLYEIDKQSR